MDCNRLHFSDHHYKAAAAAHHRAAEPRVRELGPPPATHTIGFWSETQVPGAGGFEKYKPELEHEAVERKRVKKEAADFYNSDTNNNSDTGPPTYYSLDQLHLQHH